MLNFGFKSGGQFFTLGAKYDQPRNTPIVSRRCYFRSSVAANAAITVESGLEYRLDGGAWTSANGTRGTARYIEVRMTSPNVYYPADGSTLSKSVTIGGGTFAFAVTTIIEPIPVGGTYLFQDGSYKSFSDGSFFDFN